MSIDKEAITLTLSISAAFVSAATLFVALAQVKIGSAKTRLDLYNKRFNIYTSTLDYFHAIHGASEKSSDTHRREFIRCYRESQYLFKDSDGIYATLTKIKDDGAQAIGLERQIRELDSSSLSDMLLAESCGENRERYLKSLEKSMMTLERQIASYIKFENASGWHLFK